LAAHRHNVNVTGRTVTRVINTVNVQYTLSR